MRRIASVFAASLLSLTACDSDSPTTTTDTVGGTDTSSGGGTDTSSSGTDTSSGGGMDTSSGGGTDTSSGGGTDTSSGGGTDTSSGGGTDTSSGGGTDTSSGGGTDTSTPPAGGLICTELQGCVGDAQSQADAEACFQQAASQAEGEAALASLNCPVDSGCITWAEGAQPTADEIKGYIRCAGANCIEEETTCAQGGSAGTGGCAEINGCLQSCEADDAACDRACFAAASSASVGAFIDLSFCVSAECYGVAQAQRQACVQQAVGSTGPCAPKYTTCFGAVGAAPGAGGSGGFGQGFNFTFYFAK